MQIQNLSEEIRSLDDTDMMEAGAGIYGLDELSCEYGRRNR